MKRLLAALALSAASAVSFGATQFPISLFSGAGSSAGQVPVSTGPSSAPAWGNVSVANITGVIPASQGGTGLNVNLSLGYLPVGSGTATFAAVAPGSAGTVLASNGVSAYPTYQTLAALGAGVTSASVNQFTGVTSGAAAGTGKVGELLTATGASTGATAGATASGVNLALTAGVWDVTVWTLVSPAGTTVVSNAYGGVSSAPTTLGGNGNYVQGPTVANTAGTTQAFASPLVRVSVSAGTTYYGTFNITFTTSTCNVTQIITARRVF